MTTIRFNEVSLGGPRRTFCKVCDKKLSRVVRVSETINPWNKNEDGSVKSYKEVYDSVLGKLREASARIESEGVVCAKCGRAQIPS